MWLLLPSIPRGCFLHSDPSQLSNQFLAASTYRLSEFGEGAAALQVTESVLSGTTIHSAGPAGTSIAWSTDRQTDWRTERQISGWKSELNFTCFSFDTHLFTTKQGYDWPNKNKTLSTVVLYLLQIQTPFRVLGSGSLCKGLQLVCISPASDSMMPEGEQINAGNESRDAPTQRKVTQRSHLIKSHQLCSRSHSSPKWKNRLDSKTSSHQVVLGLGNIGIIWSQVALVDVQGTFIVLLHLLILPLVLAQQSQVVQLFGHVWVFGTQDLAVLKYNIKNDSKYVTRMNTFTFLGVKLREMKEM